MAGTPQYMAPSRPGASRSTPGPTCSAWAACSTPCCTGRAAVPGRDDAWPSSGASARTAPRPIRESNPALPGWLEEIVDRLLEKDPASRFPGRDRVGRPPRKAPGPDAESLAARGRSSLAEASARGRDAAALARRHRHGLDRGRRGRGRGNMEGREPPWVGPVGPWERSRRPGRATRRGRDGSPVRGIPKGLSGCRFREVAPQGGPLEHRMDDPSRPGGAPGHDPGLGRGSACGRPRRRVPGAGRLRGHGLL